MYLEKVNHATKQIVSNYARSNVKWDIRMNGFMRIFTTFVKKHITKGTEDAIARIANKIA